MKFFILTLNDEDVDCVEKLSERNLFRYSEISSNKVDVLIMKLGRQADKLS